MQQHFDLIHRQAEGSVIYQRPADGYINATAMCQAAEKLWSDYRRLATTTSFLNELAFDMGIPISELAVSIKGGKCQAFLDN
jgi:hypothetical protein